jgi:streptogrisin C
MMKKPLVLVSACALAALTLFGGTPAASEPAVATAGMVAAMQRDLGLSEAQAQTRLRQESRAMAIDETARTAAGAAYGGSWFDPARGTLVVGLSNMSTAAAVRSTGAAVVSVPHTLAELEATKAEVDAVKAPADVAAWRVEPPRHSAKAGPGHRRGGRRTPADVRGRHSRW